jgi:polyisoprenyl-teichoic acid--peptidoglycan teichoic acid transferase
LKKKRKSSGNPAGDDDVSTKRPRRRKGRWHFPAVLLILLLITEAGLLSAAYQVFTKGGTIESLPIVTNPNSTANITLPGDLQPAPANPGDDTSSLDPSIPDVNTGKTPIYKVDQIDPDVINVLVLGLDTRTPGGNGRSDLNMIISINRKNNTVKLASLLRDTLVPIEGHDWNRLNSAYVFGGPGLTINTVNQVYKTDIQRYVKLDFFAISDIIDAVGGVDITLTQAEADWMRSQGVQITKGAGMKHLDGAKALAYARIRKIDSDFQRTQRQRNVMAAALKNLRSMGVLKAVNLMMKLLPQVKTNISSTEIVSLATGVINARGKEIGQTSIPINGAFTFKKYKGMQIISVDFNKNADALHKFIYGQ